VQPQLVGDQSHNEN